MSQSPTVDTLPPAGPALQAGDTGPDVLQLQLALAAAGFPPGMHDGQFGVGTEVAVKAFQLSCRLLPDGVVGPRTRLILATGAAAADDVPAGDATVDMAVQVAARMVPGALLRTIAQNLPKVLGALRARALADRGMVLVAVATIRAETGGFEPLDEGVSRFNTSPGGRPFDLYDFRSDLGQGAQGDGARFKGRGFAQLTGRANYRQIGQLLGLPLEGEPESANDPDIAARVLAEFLKGKERRIKQDLLDNDLRDARRAVNGGTNGLAEFVEAFQTGNRLLPA